MQDSYTEYILPFSSDVNLLEEYVNASGGIRTGKLMEHLDSLAGSISYKHVLGPTAKSIQKVEEMGLYIVTAGVERYVHLDMLRPLDSTHDLRLSGQVIYTGRSSMEVVVRIETLARNDGEKDETILLGRFSMVCRDAKTNQAHPINPINVSTQEEKTLFAIGQELKRRRASLAQRSLKRVPPSSEEAAALHENYLKFGDVIDQPNYIGYHHGKRCMLMFPQERNVHQKIFGGYLMRLAYELGFSNASMFCRGRVRFLALDEISFKLPVPIGSILRLTSVVLYDDLVKERVDGEDHVYQLHIGVRANVLDIKTGAEKTTNEFRFTWRGEEKLNDGVGVGGGLVHKVRKVVPKTYREAMLWVGSRRAVAIGDEIREATAKKREAEMK
ncbi:hypothetical protein GYMLUDRAFT_160038 [Collybiopsis luxurians FD-317 M1]|nr:hypothetical protein GYMLUDRAFT_160038 [Collybiopsis luxurians FD-317 M1]